MKCAQIRELFGAYWDDETTQAEREALEQHITACEECRSEYEVFSRTLELMGSLPRAEAAPDLVERVMAKARRVSPAPDRVAAKGLRWVPVTAAAALAVLALVSIAPWFHVTPTSDTRLAPPVAVRVPVVTPERSDVQQPTRGHGSETGSGSQVARVVVSDSLFDHSEDVEFILDPVTLKRGRVRSIAPSAAGVQGERASITF
jgi:anti-sigma factor RsiW